MFREQGASVEAGTSVNVADGGAERDRQRQSQPVFLSRVLPVRPATDALAVAGVFALAGGLLFSAPGAMAQVGPGAGTGVPLTTGPGAGASPQSAVPQASPVVTPGPAGSQPADAATGPVLPGLPNSLAQFQGLRVQAIQYEGVDFDRTDRLTSELAQKEGQPLDPDSVRSMTRRLFATGRYRDIAVRVERQGDQVTLIFSGVPRYYIGRVEIDGVQDDRLTSLLEYGTQLNPGTAYSPAQVPAATTALQQVLAQNGFYEPVVSVKTDRDDVGDQVNVTFTISTGPKARIGNVVVEGKDPGITLAEFRKRGKLKARTRVSRDTTSDALSRLQSVYQKKDRLEATITLEKSTYVAGSNTLNYTFQAEQGPIVRVVVDGLKISKGRLHLLVPVFEEGTVDIDLLNEGRYKIQDYAQQLGYFDAHVDVRSIGEGTGQQTVLYTVEPGERHRVVAVAIKGNRYFGTQLLQDRLQVVKADVYQRAGRYSTELVKSDETNLESLYRANGFKNAKVTSSIVDSDVVRKNKKEGEVAVTYTVNEGTQQRFGSVALGGVDANGQDPQRAALLKGLLGTQAGQPFSLVTLSGDRDAILSYYVSNGFDEAKIEVKQTIDPGDAQTTNIAFNVTEGPQVFIGKVLESGVHYTRPAVVNGQMRVHAGDPLDQSALLDTQRNLYNLALFNEVVAAVQNPAGDAEQKNVLVQITEAKRWDVTYGFGFEAQTGTPSRGIYSTAQGTTAAQEGKAGVSPRVSLDVSRINLRGTDNSLTLHTTYGLLEEIATLSFQNPHLLGHKNLGLQVSGGYTNVQDITTYAATTLQGDLRLSQKASRKDTFIYDLIYRRVAVNPNSLEISQDLIPLLSQPVRVAGPEVTWYHDTRDPSPLDSSKGSYTSVSNFLATSKLGSQTDFDRVDITYATYYQFGGRSKYVFARSTRIGAIDNFGINPNAGSLDCVGSLVNTNASCNPVPLPERLYAGGATSHRGFSINGAGPRDLQTGYPVGGSAVLVNTLELRLPPFTLPYVGNGISFVLFHDAGNVFQHPSDMFPSIARFHQPNQGTCQVVTGVALGTCDFNYFSHAIGIGPRYKTPVGPIRVDLSYNLNPPKYPVITGVINSPYVGQASHFNFFFSIGQSF